MILREEILKEHSKNQCNRIVDWIDDNQERFDQLFHIFLHGNAKETQRASWPLGYAVSSHPHLISKHWKSLLAYLQKPNLHNAIKRNSIRCLTFTEIPEKYRGTVMDTCFRFLESPAEAVAVKVHCLVVLKNLSAYYPEIIPEIKLVVDAQITGQTAGFKSCARKVLKNI